MRKTAMQDHAAGRECAPALSWARLLLIFLALLPLMAAAQEICDNGIDDDGNGLVDLNDTLACPCEILPPPVNMISNGSFEEHTCCPGTDPQWPIASIACANEWTNYMVSSTSDYYGCNYLPAGIPQPLPDGGGLAGFGAMVDWGATTSFYENLVQCLATPLTANLTYQFTFNMAATRGSMQPAVNVGLALPVDFGPIDLVIYGIDTCPSMPYVGYGGIHPITGLPLPAQANLCPTTLNWVELGRITYNPSNAWQELSFSFQPGFDVAAILFGPACPIPSDYISYSTSWPYFFVDDMSLVNADVLITRTGHPCTNDLVLTAAPYDDPPNSYQWYLDGVAIVGQTGPVLNASALGLAAGMYAMRVIRADGSCALAQKEVAVQYPQPLAQAAPAAGCAPLNTVLTNLSDPALSGSLLWDLGDGTTSNSATVNHSYTQPGTYDVRLTVTSAEGCTADSLFQALVTVHPKPVVAFAPDSTIGCTGTAVNFTSNITPPGNYNLQWSFGDGATATTTGTGMAHVYNAPGTYNVMLMATSPFGCTGELLMPQLVQILPTPEPAFSLSPASGCIPLNVRFDNLTPGQDGLGAFWDLGNGQTDTSMSTSATYTQPGSYTVSLTMTNALGCSATQVQTDAVTANGLPVVTFFARPDTGCAPLEVEFANTTDPGMIGGCLWQFGDGQAASDCSLMHTYTQPGTYTVSLTITSPAGCDGDTTIHHLVQVNPSPSAAFTHAPWPTDFYHPLINFTDLSSSDVVQWQWSFEEGEPATADQQHPRSTFPGDGPGGYLAELIVANQFGCTDTAARTITIDGVFSVYVPNAFTPDGNGVNDLFVPVVRDHDPRYYQFSVFDRWGTEVFSTQQPGQGWDGRVSGEEPKTDVYNWQLKVRNGINAASKLYRGKVVLLK